MTDERISPASGEPPDDSVLAAEYVMGLMDSAARAEFEARLSASPALVAEVTRWQQDLAGMALALPPETPSPQTRDRLETALFGAPLADAPEARRRPAARDTGYAQAGRALRRFWQGLALGAATGGAALAVLVLGIPGALDPVLSVPGRAPLVDPAAQAQVFAAEVSGEAGLRLLAVYAPQDGVLRLTRTQGAAPPGRVLELWVIAGQAAPVSLGVLPDGATAALTVRTDLRSAVAGGLLAISDEPPGGSPTGAPTGSVLATGAVIAL